MFLPILFIIIGLAVLIVGAEVLVRGASSIARRFGLSPLMVGLTIVAFGTSAPELIVNLFASIGGNTDIAISNILGSNIVNILMILGIAALITPLAVQRSTTWKEIPFALLAGFLVFVMGSDHLFDGIPNDALTRTDGVALIGIFFIFLYYTVGIAKVEKNTDDGIRIYRTPIAIIMTLGGIFLLFIGGKVLVDNAVELANLLGVAESIIGLTVVAIGTSLPELATSVVAALHKQDDIAVGNVVGSNIFNVFWILGLSSVIRPLPFSGDAQGDAVVAIVATLLLFLAMFTGRRHTIDRWQGGAFLALYVAFIVFRIVI
ncbi:MAG: calcium/sodium antiporter [Patescibacteria group bacterium]|jgi:cation:H+ antiporter